MVPPPVREEWRCATITVTAVPVMTFGTSLMLESSAGNLDTTQLVGFIVGERDRDTCLGNGK